ncbi:hypothetical protein GCM10009721_29520 [Terrabacter tumescens]|uniref:Uncharacterized protein n=1 Tax=Terrabacter tumescens TaxID=60443 RepID=A0ABQ2I7S0_9MICO|nr:hypothetical protein GCM10009721_29520 [Terrabacter tumescens]
MPVASVRTTVALPVGRPATEVGAGLDGVAVRVVVEAGGVGAVVAGVVDGVCAGVVDVDVVAGPLAGEVLVPDDGAPDEQAAADRARATVAARATRPVRSGMGTSVTDGSERACAPSGMTPVHRREQSGRPQS